MFRWQLNDGAKRTHKTLICNTCARVRNCCQGCMLDINFLIPLDIRDTALRMAGLEHLIPESSNSRNAEVKAIKADKQQAHYEKETNLLQHNEKAKEILQKLSLGVNEDSKNNESAGQGKLTSSIKPKKEVSTTIPANLSKIIKSLPFNGSIEIPGNTLTSFFVFGIPEDLPQYIIADFFQEFGKLKSISIIHRAKCGFVSYSSRKSAEALAQAVIRNGLNDSSKTPGMVILNQSVPVRIAWSDIKLLGSSGSDHKKIGLVVVKIMLQLAEKSKQKSTKKQENQAHNSQKQSRSNKIPHKSHSNNQNNSKTKSNQSNQKSTTFNSAQMDFEL